MPANRCTLEPRVLLADGEHELERVREPDGWEPGRGGKSDRSIARVEVVAEASPGVALRGLAVRVRPQGDRGAP